MDKKRTNIGIIGCGNIGSALAVWSRKNISEYVSRVILWDTDTAKMASLKKKLGPAVCASGIEQLVDMSGLVIEAVSPPIVKGLLTKAVRKGKDIIIMSVGGILGNTGLLDKARRRGVRVIFPSGAIAGIDALKAAKMAGLSSVTITTRKPLGSIKYTPYLAAKGIKLDSITKETVIFEGSAREAVRAFPMNINVSALLSLAGIGEKRTKVRMIVSPEYVSNSHEIEIKGKSGVIFSRTENIPSPSNPGTSYLAVLSAMAALKEYYDVVKIGT